MMTTTNRKLAKGFCPVLLLSAALSLPAVSVAAPSPKEHGKARAAEQWNQKQQNKAVRAAAKQELRAQRQQQWQQKQWKQQQRAQRQTQRQAVKVQRQELRQNRAAKKSQIVIVPSRRAARAPVAVRPGRVVQAPVVVRPIRKVAPAPVIVQRAPVYSTPYVANRATRTRPWYGWNNRKNYSRYGSGEFQLEGTFVGQQYGCALLQDNQGQVIPLLNNPGDLERGDHLLLTGRIQNNSVCGTAFRIFNVDDVWNDRNDRSYQGDRYDRYNDRYDRYDNRGNRDLISVNGYIDRGLACTSIDADNGERYALSGDLQDFRDGDHVRVIGFVGGRSLCGARTLEVQEIRGR